MVKKNAIPVQKNLFGVLHKLPQALQNVAEQPGQNKFFFRVFCHIQNYQFTIFFSNRNSRRNDVCSDFFLC